MAPKTDVIAELRARVAELSTEVERLSTMCACDPDFNLSMYAGGASKDGLYGTVTMQMRGEFVKYVRAEQLLLAQAEIKRLRKHTEWNKRIKDSVDKLLEMAGYHVESSSRHQLGLMNFDCIAQPSDTSALDAYVAEKVKEYQKHNGILGREVKDLTRQRDLAVEALDRAVQMVGHPDNIAYLQQALSTIKESEAK